MDELFFIMNKKFYMAVIAGKPDRINGFYAPRPSISASASHLLPHNFFHEADELLFFLRFGADVDDLEDVVIGRELEGSDGYVHVVMEEILRQRPNFLGPGGAEHEDLPIRPDLIDDFPNLRLETHVQHPA